MAGYLPWWLVAGDRLEYKWRGGVVYFSLRLIHMSATVQIKRKRDQDPLSALMVRSSKRSRGDLVFRLAGTYDEALPDNFILQESGDRVFKRIKSESKKADRKSSDAGPSLPPEITEMLNEYVKAHPATIDAETEDYVYDIYYGERGGEPDSTASTTSVGYM